MEEEGLPREALLPVNRCAAAAARIRDATGVRAAALDVFDLAARLRERASHVLWLDLEENGARLPDGAVAAAARGCAVVHLTLSCRAEDKYAVSRRAEALLAGAGLRRALTTQYPGRSGVTQMVHATALRRDAELRGEGGESAAARRLAF